MEKIYNRIFVGKYEMAYAWTKNSLRIFDNLNDKDLFLIYIVSEGNLPAQSKRYIDKLGDHAIVRDVSAMGDEDRWKTTIEDLLTYQNPDTYVCFLHDNDAFQYCVSKSLPFKNIKSFQTLLQASTAYNKYMQDKKKKQEWKNKQEEHKNKNDLSGNEVKVQEKEKKSEFIPENNSKQDNKKTKPEQNKQNKKPEPRNVSVDDEDALGDILNQLAEAENTAASVNKQEEDRIKDDSESDNKPDAQKNQNKGKPSGKKEPEKSEQEIYDRTLEDIEKEIFSGEISNEKIVRKYSELDDFKAKTANLTFERLVNGINKYIKKEVAETLKPEDYYAFIMALLKSYTFDEFAESWKTTQSFEILLNADEYRYLKEEAIYYNDMCKMFYKDDKW